MKASEVFKREIVGDPTEFKHRWIAALKSGKYRQGTGRLKLTHHVATEIESRKKIYRDDFCCLGVGCEIISPEGFIDRGTTWGSSYYYVEWMTDEGRGLTVTLINLNDSENKSFNQIADFIALNVEDDEPVSN